MALNHDKDFLPPPQNHGQAWSGPELLQQQQFWIFSSKLKCNFIFFFFWLEVEKRGLHFINLSIFHWSIVVLNLVSHFCWTTKWVGCMSIPLPLWPPARPAPPLQVLTGLSSLWCAAAPTSCLFYTRQCRCTSPGLPNPPPLPSAEKATAPHSSTLAWKIPWTDEPGGLQSTGSQRAGHDWATSLSLFTFMHWRRKWQPTALFLPGEFQGRGSLVGCRLWGRTESDTNEET